MHPEEQYAVRAIRAGAAGYLTKDSNSDLLLPAIRKVAAGGIHVSPKVAEMLVLDASRPVENARHTQLSNREYEVFLQIIHGKSLSEVADELSLSIKTVSTHKVHILEKMGLSNTVDLVRYAIAHQLLDEPPV